jgi:hypothetical protein
MLRAKAKLYKLKHWIGLTTRFQAYTLGADTLVYLGTASVRLVGRLSGAHFKSLGPVASKRFGCTVYLLIKFLKWLN